MENAVFDGRPVAYKTTVTTEMVIEIIEINGFDPEIVYEYLEDDSGRSFLAKAWGLEEPVCWNVFLYQIEEYIEEQKEEYVRDLVDLMGVNNPVLIKEYIVDEIVDSMGVNTPVFNDGCRRVNHGGFDRSGEDDTTGYEEHYEKGGDF